MELGKSLSGKQVKRRDSALTPTLARQRVAFDVKQLACYPWVLLSRGGDWDILVHRLGEGQLLQAGSYGGCKLMRQACELAPMRNLLQPGCALPTAGEIIPRCKHAPCGHSRTNTVTAALSGGMAVGSTTFLRAEL